MDVARDGAVLGGEPLRRHARRGLDADAPGEAAELQRIVGQRVGLELVHDLQPVLDRAQMDERVGEPPAEIRREVAALGQAEEHTSELQSPCNLVCRLLLEKKKRKKISHSTTNEGQS